MRELGLRMALGASARQLLTKILREGFALTAIGLMIGFGLSLATGQILGRVLYGTSPTDIPSPTVACLRCWRQHRCSHAIFLRDGRRASIR